MRTSVKNKQKMYYALLDNEIPVYERDAEGNIIYYTDADGNKIPLEAGETELGYSEPIEFFGNIALSGGESEAVEYGIDVSAYDAALIVDKNAIPLSETSLIWFESEIGYKDTDKTVVDPNSADYKVLEVKPSLNVSKYILGKMNK